MPAASLRSAVRAPRSLLIGAAILLLIVTLGFAFYVNGRRVLDSQLREELKSYVTLAAAQFDTVSLDRIRTAKDLQTPELRDTVALLNRIRSGNLHIRFAYIMRKTDMPTEFAFIADADSLKSTDELDVDHNGIVEKNEQASYPGDVYDISDSPWMIHGFESAYVDDQLTVDQWGTFISAYAPVIDARGRAVAVLGIDMDASEYLTHIQRIFSPAVLLLVLVVAVLMGAYTVIFIGQRRLETMGELDRQRSALMQLISHQLGAPLSSFKWSLDFMREVERKYHTAEGDTSVQMLSEGIARMEGMMNALHQALDVSNSRAGAPPEPANLLYVLEHVAAETSAVRSVRQQQLLLRIPQDLPALSIDANLLSAVLRELIDNAITYSPAGATVTIRAWTEGKHVRIDVRDEGKGIPKRDLPHMFERFSRGSTAYLSKPVGNGLGLFTARGIIRRAGGDMWVESEEGKGTVVAFTLPRQK